MSINAASLNVPVPTSRVKQILTLVRRRLLSFYRDKTDLAITFGQAPLLAIAFFFVFQEIVTIGETDSFFQPLREYLTQSTVSIIIFLAILTAVWFGSSKAIVEIPGSKVLYQQERLSFLGDFEYLIAIFIALSILAFGQVLLFSLTFHLLFVSLPAWFEPYQMGMVAEESASISFMSALKPTFFLDLTLLLWLTAIAAIAVAMFVSMFTHSRSAANAILPFLLIVQILFAGSVIKPVIYMSPMIKTLANVMVSRWGFEGAVLLFERDLNLSMPRRETYDTIFASFNFNYGLKRLDTKGYISQTIATGPEQLNKNSVTAKVWQSALSQAAEELKYLSSDVTDEESQYIDKLEQAQWKVDKLDKPLPERLLKKTEAQFERIYANQIGELMSKIDNGKIVTESEQKIWEDIISADASLKLFRRAHLSPLDKEDLSSEEKSVWADKFEKQPDLQLFKATVSMQIAWLMLFILTAGFFLLGWAYFVITKKSS
jgi:signal transduction histidine kinase